MLKVDDNLYIQPDDIDVVPTLADLASDITLKENEVNVDLEPKSITEFNPQKKPAPKMEIGDLQPAPKPEAPAKVKEEDKAVAAAEYKQEKTTGDFDTQVMAALQNTHPKNRSKAPEEFFLAYSDSTICIPVFLFYLFIIVLTKTVGAIFH